MLFLLNSIPLSRWSGCYHFEKLLVLVVLGWFGSGSSGDERCLPQEHRADASRLSCPGLAPNPMPHPTPAAPLPLRPSTSCLELLLLPSPPLRLARKTCTGLSAGGKDHDNWVLGGEAPPLPSKQPQQPKGEAQPEDGLLDPLAHKFSRTRQGRAWVGPGVLHRQVAVRVSRPLPRATPFPTLELCYFLI